MESKTIVKNTVRSNGIGFLGTLAIAFIVLKLLDKISWSWLWVLAPLWIPAALIIGILIIWVLVEAILLFIKRRGMQHSKKMYTMIREAIDLIENEPDPLLREEYWEQYFMKKKKLKEKHVQANRLAYNWESRAGRKGLLPENFFDN